MEMTNEIWESLAKQLKGELHYDSLMKSIYATDASVYQELPLAVAYPKNDQDVINLVHFANKYKITLIPRAAGTSLAGQCVGKGIVVDISKHFTKIIEINSEEKWVRVQPGVIRNELNDFLKPYGLFFSPVTATANRAMIGGMIGNNSSGQNSIVYGTTRDHALEVDAILSNGDAVRFGPLSMKEFESKCNQDDFEGKLYRNIQKELTDVDTKKNIKAHFPHPEIKRRNTGYAVDALLDTNVFGDEQKPFNFTELICGSEGTLALVTEGKLHLDPLPPVGRAILAAHFSDVRSSMLATQFVMEFSPDSCELMDDTILVCTSNNPHLAQKAHFIQGEPKTVLLIEKKSNSEQEAIQQLGRIEEKLREENLGYAYSYVGQDRVEDVWTLRRAGLGLLANLEGDAKAVACIEDTAVRLEDLADYIDEFEELMQSFGQSPVYYAHAGAGELHLRPILDLKTSQGVKDFEKITLAVAKLVKKYKGSLSGEHGDGRVRSPFIEYMLGQDNYELLKRIKYTWDPNGIFNKGKITDATPMTESLRYEVDQDQAHISTIFSFENEGGILRLSEKCNGSGDCRKLPSAGGVMCPSYHATKDEKDTTRARANILRQFLTNNKSPNPFDHPEIKEVLDLCIGCKGCSTECPSSVDMAVMKAEFLYQYRQSNGTDIRDWFFWKKRPDKQVYNSYT